jgi:hypothetical protein
MTSSHHTFQNFMPGRQLANLILQVLPAALGGRRLRCNGLDFGIGEGIDNDGGEYPLQAADDVPLDDLGGRICDKCLQRDLNKTLASAGTMRTTMRAAEDR